MDVMILVLLTIGLTYCVYLAGHIAERRGRSFKAWAWIAVIIGPLALLLVYLFPDLRRENSNHA